MFFLMMLKIQLDCSWKSQFKFTGQRLQQVPRIPKAFGRGVLRESVTFSPAPNKSIRQIALGEKGPA